MNIFALLTWAIVQIFLFGLSVWFLVYGIRIWHRRKYLAAIVFIFAFVGVINVIVSLMKAGFI